MIFKNTRIKTVIAFTLRRMMTVHNEERLSCCIEILYVQALLTGGYPMRNHEMQLLNGNLLRLLDWSLSEDN